MRNIKLSILAFTLLSLAVACARTNTTEQTPNANTTNAPPSSPSPQATTDALADARAYYAENCAKCHRENGEGGLYEEEVKPLKVPSLATGRAVAHTDERYTRQITRGGDGMPAFGDKLTPQQIGDLVRFVRREFQNKVSARLSIPPQNH